MRCPRCDSTILPPATSCGCGTATAPSAPMAPTSAKAPDGVVGKMVPTGNKPALVAYYCGLFSVIPYAGFVLAPTAIVAGVVGLNLANRRPEARGKIHAWVGIVAAIGLGALGYVLKDNVSSLFGTDR